MREAADQIRTEVGHMMKDVGLLSERVAKLQTHFGQTNEGHATTSSISAGKHREARRPHRGTGVRRRRRARADHRPRR